MGNKTGSVRKLDDDETDSDEEKISSKTSSIRKHAQPTSTKGYDTEPAVRRKSSGGTGDPIQLTASAAASTSKKKSSSLLSEHQKSLISRSWKQHVNRHSTENIGVRILLNVFDASPEIRQIFGFDASATREMLIYDKRFQKLAKQFIRVIDEAIRDIEDLEEDVQTRLRSLGARHVKYRSAAGAFKMQHWDTFAESMLEAIIDTQRGVHHKYRDTTATWRIFISWMIGIMKQGYYETLRAERRMTTAGLPQQLSVDATPFPRNQRTVSTGCGPKPNIQVPNYTRNHSVVYTATEADDFRQQLQPHQSTAKSHHYSQYLEPASSTSAPHSPYAIKSPHHYAITASPEIPQQSPQHHGSYAKRGSVMYTVAEQEQLVITRGRMDPPTRYESRYPDEEREAFNEDDSRGYRRDPNYPSDQYYSDYY